MTNKHKSPKINLMERKRKLVHKNVVDSKNEVILQ